MRSTILLLIAFCAVGGTYAQDGTAANVNVGAPRTQRAAPAAIPPLSLNVEGIGSMDCPPNAEPADVVLKFAIAASEAGVAMNTEAMQDMLKYFCDRRPCTRGLVGPIELEIPGVGKAVCRPWDSPATVTENLAKAAAAQGINLGLEDLTKIMQFWCQRKPCFRKIAPPVVLDVDGVGQATVRIWEDPADVVEMFARAALQAGVDFPDQGMVQMLEYFCARRPCKRTQLQSQRAQQAPQQVVGMTGGGAPAAPATGGGGVDAEGELDLSAV